MTAAGVTMTLADFLLARIAEDEATARDVHAWSEAPREDALPWQTTPADGRVVAWGLTVVGVANTPVLAEHIARWDPARVLAECETKRRIVERWQETAATEMPWGGFGWADARTQEINETLTEEVLPFLALPYADHPDYREEWKP